jgi:hypothetical protein
VKLKIDVDEVWPIFTCDETKEDAPFVVEVDVQFYKEYLWFFYRYHKIQNQLKVMYDEQLRKHTGRSIFRFPEGSEVEPIELNRIRNAVTETKV